MWIISYTNVIFLWALIHNVHRLMLSNSVKWTIFYHITVILQYYLDKTIERSGDMYRDYFGTLTLVIKCFGITNTSVQNFTIRISAVKTVPNCLRKLKVVWTNWIYIFLDVSSLWMSSLLTIVLCQKYFGNHVISSQIHLFAPLFIMRRCTLCNTDLNTNENMLLAGLQHQRGDSNDVGCKFLGNWLNAKNYLNYNFKPVVINTYSYQIIYP